jgi:hypothetical protein
MPLFESPRYLVGNGQDEEAVKVTHNLAKFNGRASSLTIEDLLVVGHRKSSETSALAESRDLKYIICVTFRHVKGLFATPKMALSTTLLFMISCACTSLRFSCDTNSHFAVLIGTAISLYFMFLPYM